MRIVVPFGFYGAGNIGDEATLNGFARLLALSGAHVQASVASRNAAHTARVEPKFRYFSSCGYDPRRWLAKLTASAHVMVGGTPIMDVLGDWPLSELAPLVRSTDRWKVPLTFIGVGTETLRFEKSRRIVAAEIVPRVRHWSVRCDRDCERLVEYGVAPSAITVAADLAWLIEAVPPDFGQGCLRRWGIDLARPLIGVNLVNENSVFDQHPKMVDSLAGSLDVFVEQMDAQVIFLANEVRQSSTFDRAAAIQVIGRMKRADHAAIPPNEYFSPRRMMSIIGHCLFTMSMRYHFCLFSALQRVPFIAIERSDKVSDLCWDIGWPARIVSQEFDASDLVEHGSRLREYRPPMEAMLEEATRKLRKRALRNVAALQAISGGHVLTQPVEVA